MRTFLADTFALVAFSTLAGLLTELLVAGMSLAQSAQARATAVPATLLTARPYGLFRDWVFRVSGAEAGGPARRALADVAAFVAFQVPVYAAILALAGASPEQMAKACGTAAIVLAVSGRPYGLFLELSRRLFGVAGAEARRPAGRVGNRVNR